MISHSIQSIALFCCELPGELQRDILPALRNFEPDDITQAFTRVRGMSAPTRLELMNSLLERLARQQPELLTLLLQSFEDVSNKVEQTTVEDDEDFVGPFVYRLLPPDVARQVDITLGSRPGHWSQRIRVPCLASLSHWLEEAVESRAGALQELIEFTVAMEGPAALESLSLALIRFHLKIGKLNLEEKVRAALRDSLDGAWHDVMSREGEVCWQAVVDTLVRLARCNPEAFALGLLQPPKVIEDLHASVNLGGFDPPPTPFLQGWLVQALPEKAELLWRELGKRRKLRNKLHKLVTRYDLKRQAFLGDFERYLSFQRVLNSPLNQGTDTVKDWFDRRKSWAGNSPLAFLRLLLRFLQIEVKELRTRALRLRLGFLSVALQLATTGPNPLSQALRENYPDYYGFEPRKEALTSFERIRSLEIFKRFMEAYPWKSTVALHLQLGEKFVSALTCEELVSCWLDFVKDSPRWR